MRFGAVYLGKEMNKGRLARSEAVRGFCFSSCRIQSLSYLVSPGWCGVMRLSSVTCSLIFLSPSAPGEARRYGATSHVSVSLGCREKVAEGEELIPRVGLEWRKEGWERGISTQKRGICP